MATDPPDKIDRLLADWRRECPALDAGAMQVVGRLLSLGRQLEDRAAAVLKPHGLHYTDLDVLATLRRQGPPFQLTPTELRGSVLLTSGAMTACLDRLERNGWITRVANAADRRSTAAALTEAGRALIDEVIVLRFAEARDALAPLDPAEQQQLAQLLRKLGRGLSASD